MPCMDKFIWKACGFPKKYHFKDINHVTIRIVAQAIFKNIAYLKRCYINVYTYFVT